jgi:hypothetical protein
MPPCAQERHLPPGEHLISEDLLLRLPPNIRRDIPKILRVFLGHHRDVLADIVKPLFDILSRFFSQAAGLPIRSAIISSHQTFREFGVWHPRWHRIVRE